jgi:imidazole glycerol phosphate synthase subunit HisF
MPLQSIPDGITCRGKITEPGKRRGSAEIVLAASIFRFSILSIREVKEYLESKGLKVHHEKEGTA